MAYPKTVEAMLLLTDVPVVAIDQESIFTFVNGAFEEEYGWTSEDLIGKPVTEIMPSHMRSGHNVGFARFLTTETSELLGKPLPLSVRYKNGSEKLSDHFILSEKKDGRWRFSAIIDYPERNA
ncbi:MAG: PAS domain S-box protein [Patescibacteria group bacterium]|nr:PAS domain S-box protein [Patescibacteria group bacterium]